MTAHHLIRKRLFAARDDGFLPAGDFLEIGSARQEDNKAFERSSTWHLHGLAKELGKTFRTIDIVDRKGEQKLIDDACFVTLDDAREFRLAGPLALLFLDGQDVLLNREHEADLRSRVGTLYEDRGVELSNRASAVTHLAQLLHFLPAISNGGLVCVDDTRFDYRANAWWGKGALVAPYLVGRRHHILNIGYGGILFQIAERFVRAEAADLDDLVAAYSKVASFGDAP